MDFSLRLRERPRQLAAAGLLILWAGASILLAVWFSGRIRDWVVMTDEMQYAKLATSIGDTGSPLPRLHGQSVGVFNQLYPLLLAPFYGFLSTPSAFRAAHILNAVIMASASVPAYLLGRQVLPRLCALVVAALCVLVPWMVLTGFLMTEVVAYPAFLWAILAICLATLAPSRRQDLLAVAALGLAVLARTQFSVLAAVLPIAVLGYEISAAFGVQGGFWIRLRTGLLRGAQRHPLLVGLYAVGIVVVIVAALAGSVGSLLGNYSTTVESGSLLPRGVWASAARHLDVVAIGCGLLPLVLGGGWILATAVRGRGERERALAIVSLATLVLLTFEAASYNVRFGSADLVRDRYLYYVVPLLLVGTGAALMRAVSRDVVVGAVLVTAFFGATVPLVTFRTSSGVLLDSPASTVNGFLEDQSGSLSTATFVAVVGVLIGLVLVLAYALVPRPLTTAAITVGLLAFSILTLRTEVHRIVTGTGLTGRPLAGPPGRVLDWIDGVLPDGADAAAVPFPLTTSWDTTAIGWWDVEFWNRTITETFVAPDGNFTYTPFPTRTLRVDWASGAIPGTDHAPRFAVTAPNDPRFLLAGSQHAANLGLVVRAVDVPYHVIWASRGLRTDGWTRPDRRGTIRVYGADGEGATVTSVAVTLQAPPTAGARYMVSAAGESRRNELDPNAARTETLDLCIPPRGHTDVTVDAPTSARVEGPPTGPDAGEITRRVGVAVVGVGVQPTEEPCTP